MIWNADATARLTACIGITYDGGGHPHHKSGKDIGAAAAILPQRHTSRGTVRYLAAVWVAASLSKRFAKACLALPGWVAAFA